MVTAADKGIVDRPTNHSVEQTVDRLRNILQSKGVTLFALIDHSGEAEKVGMTMRPTKLLIFGSPKAGTPLLLAAPSIAIDLPLKILVWEDSEGKVPTQHRDVLVRKGSHHDLRHVISVLRLSRGDTHQLPYVRRKDQP